MGNQNKGNKQLGKLLERQSHAQVEEIQFDGSGFGNLFDGVGLVSTVPGGSRERC